MLADLGRKIIYCEIVGSCTESNGRLEKQVGVWAGFRKSLGSQ